MIRKIKVMTAIYSHIDISAGEARKLRGFFGNQNANDEKLHNHLQDGSQVYKYPVVQYKVLWGHPAVTAAEEGIISIYPLLMQNNELCIGSRSYTDTFLDIQISERLIGDSRKIQNYQFLTPWIALNQKNYRIYQKMGYEEQEAFLNKILIGNVLAFYKNFGVTIEQKLEAEHELKMIPIVYKKNKMIGFIGRFSVNCYLPDLFGIGKGVSRGFGTIKSVREKEQMHHE